MNEIFGSRRRTEVLLLLSKLERSYASELARALQAPLRSVQKILDSLENQDVLIGSPLGRIRFVEINPRLTYRDELKSLLERMAEADAEVMAAAMSIRRRPRKKDKPL